MPLRPESPYTEEVRTLHAAYCEELRKVAARVRTEVIIPFCNRHGVSFLCGMGEYTFHEEGDEEWERHATNAESFGWSTSMRPTDAAPEGYKEVFEALNTEVPDNMGYNLFLFMESYDPKEAA